jgi:hypothetical protein
MRFHWQNLCERPKGCTSAGDERIPTDFPWQGRCWLHLLSEKTIGFEWIFGLTQQFSVGFKCRASENQLMFHVGIPWLCTFYFTFERFLAYATMSKLCPNEDKEINIYTHEHAFIWQIWCDTNSWSNKTSWRSGSIDFANLIFGKTQYYSRPLQKKQVDIPMPEGPYKAEITLTEDTWKRPRWFVASREYRAKIELEKPIPHPGKGTCSHNCNDDGLYGLTTNAKTIAEAIGVVVASVYDKRNRYPL